MTGDADVPRVEPLVTEVRVLVIGVVGVQDGYRACGLLYLVAVRNGSRQQEHCQARLDTATISLGTGLSRLADHGTCSSEAFSLSVSARYRPPQTVPSGTQRHVSTHHRSVAII